MSIVWLLEKPITDANRIFFEISGSFPIRLVASLDSLFVLGKRLDEIESPKLIVINQEDFTQEEVTKVQEAFQVDVIVASSLVCAHQDSDLPFKISQVLRKSPIVPKYFINFESMSLVMPHQECEIPLSHREAKIMKALMEQPGVPLSRKHLQDEVWGSVKVARSTVDSQISRLRRKLDATFLDIDSVYGGGYKLTQTNL